ncbi:alpha/beta hydrolase [Shewanella surugensis]|uniref:Alpha/beta hydrolase n=1 Tax=Shewanella surugensis TaxID=212020 RepID=A0ABT0LF88_9GAMM|nr:alpha/beta hydrolase [Shewanella surugensis]MCL1126359.1 alpha/beta hydrolase [Shewanella surugensis]
MSVVPLERITIEPKLATDACVIWLHGLGDSGAGFSPVVPALGLGTQHSIRFIFPHAPEQAVTINAGHVMRSWYDIKSMDLLDRADMAGVLASETQVKALIAEQEALGIATDKIILAGFSQGGVMSLFTGLRYPKKLAGIMGLSCYLPAGDQLPEGLSEPNSATPILQNHGLQDEVVPFEAGMMAKEALLKANYQTQWQAYTMGHNVLPQQLTAIGRWINQCLASA